MREDDVPEADRIMRVAFGTLLGMPEPAAAMGDRAGLYRDAYRRLPAEGYRTQMYGVAMPEDNVAGYRVPQAFVVDDWR